MNFKLVIFQYRVTRKALFRATRRSVLSERQLGHENFRENFSVLELARKTDYHLSLSLFSTNT